MIPLIKLLVAIAYIITYMSLIQLKPEDIKMECEGDGDRSPQKLTTPLAGMLPPEWADKDVQEIFPEFRPGKVSAFCFHQYSVCFLAIL